MLYIYHRFLLQNSPRYSEQILGRHNCLNTFITVVTSLYIIKILKPTWVVCYPQDMHCTNKTQFWQYIFHSVTKGLHSHEEIISACVHAHAYMHTHSLTTHTHSLTTYTHSLTTHTCTHHTHMHSPHTHSLTTHTHSLTH